MAKDIIMNTNEAELKAIAKAAGASLKRQGHAVPHSAVLNALSAALNKRDWQTLKASLNEATLASQTVSTDGASESGVVPVVAEPLALQGPRVSAEFWTDDRTFTVEFDARAFLGQATDKALKAIYEVGFCGDYCTDAIAEHMSDNHLNEEIRSAFVYLNAVNLARETRGDSVGFECRVDGKEFLQWMAAQKTALLADILCDALSVDLVEAQEEEIAGMWDWLDSQGNACDYSLPTREAAALDAYEKLDLLQEAISTL